MRKLYSLVVLFLGLGATAPAWAQSICGVDYTAQQGDTPSRVAQLHYGNPDRWRLVTDANPPLTQAQDGQIAQGTQIFIPCTAPDATIQAMTPAHNADVIVSAPDGLAPFVSQTWPAQGMFNELLAAALSGTVAPVVHAIRWQDESYALDAQSLSAQQLDMAVIWAQRGCLDDPAPAMCDAFHVSDPFVEVPVMLFVRSDSGFTYESRADLAGLHICQPTAVETKGADRRDPPWLSGGAIKVEAPAAPETCFQMLMEGQVDAVAMNALMGSSTIAAMGLSKQVLAVERPLSNETLHIAVPKVHWRGTTLIYRVNSGLAELRESGLYDQIVDRHMSVLWDRLN